MSLSLMRFVAGATLLLTLAACPATPTGSVNSVTIIGGDRTLVEGASITLDVDVDTTGSVTDTVTWSSSNDAVATIDAGGTLTAFTPGTTVITATSTADLSKIDSITVTVTVTVNPPGTLRWTRQFGTSDFDRARGVATDADGNIYTTGHTRGALEGSGAGEYDAFIRSYDTNGDLRWTRQFGTNRDDRGHGVATDANGNVYTTGYTSGALEGANAGGTDAFIRSYDTNGNLRWTRQFGTIGDEFANGIATDANGNVYTTGYTWGVLEGANAGHIDAFIRSYDVHGDERWTRQFGTNTEDRANGIATDANGNVYTSGYTSGTLEGANAGETDAFIRSYGP